MTSLPPPHPGFVGLGVMGSAMAARLLSSHAALRVFSRRKVSAAPLLDAGAVWAESPADLARDCDIVFTMVGYPQDVEEVYFGPHGLLHTLREGAIVVDFTTSSPALARRIATAAAAKGAFALDAPVSGGDVGAKNGTLSIMCGGETEALDRVRVYLQELGKTLVYQGPPGAGQSCKLCNQITVASTMIGVCEALVFAHASGLNPRTVLESIQSGAAASWTLSNLAPRMLEGDFAPGFYVKHLIKDLRIARDEADSLGLNLPGLDLTLSRYEALARHGFEDLGTQALWKLYSRDASS